MSGVSWCCAGVRNTWEGRIKAPVRNLRTRLQGARGGWEGRAVRGARLGGTGCRTQRVPALWVNLFRRSLQEGAPSTRPTGGLSTQFDGPVYPVNLLRLRRPGSRTWATPPFAVAAEAGALPAGEAGVWGARLGCTERANPVRGYPLGAPSGFGRPWHVTQRLQRLIGQPGRFHQ